MHDNLKQRIATMKAAAEKARDAYGNLAWFTVPALQHRNPISVIDSEHIAQASPVAVLALIGELERLERENERIRKRVREQGRRDWVESHR